MTLANSKFFFKYRFSFDISLDLDCSLNKKIPLSALLCTLCIIVVLQRSHERRCQLAELPSWHSSGMEKSGYTGTSEAGSAGCSVGKEIREPFGLCLVLVLHSVAQLCYLLREKSRGCFWIKPEWDQVWDQLLWLAETATLRCININQFCFKHKSTLLIFEVPTATRFS